MSRTKERTQILHQGFVRFASRAVPLVPKNAAIEPCELRQLSKDEQPTYQEIKKTFKQDLNIRDNRFYLSEMIANQLSVEEEEKKRFEKRVDEEVERRLGIIKAEAHSEAFAKGLAEGTAKAYQEEKARIAKELEMLVSSLNAMELAKEALASQYENALLDIAFRLAETIVHHEITDRPDAIHFTITEILGRIAKEDDVRIRLSAEDFDIISKAKTEIQKLGRLGRVTFDIESSLKSGDCIVESLSGEIASYVSEKIANLKAKLMTDSKTPAAPTEKVG